MSLALSVVVPTFNRLERLKSVLYGLESQSMAMNQFEVIVISDGATDGTNRFLKTYTSPLNLTFVQQTNSGPSSARNRGVSLASANLILFLDDDVVPHEDLLTNHLQSYQTNGGLCVSIGPMCTPSDAKLSLWETWEQAQLERKYKRMTAGELLPNPHQFYTGNASVGKALFCKAGGFNETIWRAEDLELGYRLYNHRAAFYFMEEAIGYHYLQRPFSSWLKTPYIYGENSVRFAQELGHETLLNTILNGYQYHHPLTKMIVSICLDRLILSRMTIRLLKQAAIFSNRWDKTAVSNAALSGIFNLQRYQGVADALQGREHFFAQIKSA